MRKALAFLILLGLFAALSSNAAPAGGKSLGDVAIEVPDASAIWRVISLRDHNTRIVLAGVTMLGAASGLVGVFLLLRKRSLLSDTISHACLPGIAAAFLLGEAMLGSGKQLPLLLAGATVTGLMGIALVSLLRRWLNVKEDAALALVLSVLFAAGVVLLSLAQQMPAGNAAGLKGFIFGKAAAMTTQDAQLISLLSLGVLALVLVLKKELTLLCFDEGYASAQGWPVVALDFALMGLVVASTVIGLQAVGLLLVVALLIIPPAAARFWSHKLGTNLILSASIGALSGALGVLASALLPKLPAGAVIVLAALALFLVSMALGPARGLLHRWLEAARLQRMMERDHALRALYELIESRAVETDEAAFQSPAGVVTLTQLQGRRSWTPTHLRRLIARLEREGLVVELDAHRLQLTRLGWNEARRVTRNHRLWELYLIHYADSAPAMVDHEADAVEHVVGVEVARRLEELMRSGGAGVPIPPSPHMLNPAANGGRH